MGELVRRCEEVETNIGILVAKQSADVANNCNLVPESIALARSATVDQLAPVTIGSQSPPQPGPIPLTFMHRANRGQSRSPQRSHWQRQPLTQQQPGLFYGSCGMSAAGAATPSIVRLSAPPPTIASSAAAQSPRSVELIGPMRASGGSVTTTADAPRVTGCPVVVAPQPSQQGALCGFASAKHGAVTALAGNRSGVFPTSSKAGPIVHRPQGNSLQAPVSMPPISGRRNSTPHAVPISPVASPRDCEIAAAAEWGSAGMIKPSSNSRSATPKNERGGAGLLVPASSARSATPSNMSSNRHTPNGFSSPALVIT